MAIPELSPGLDLDFAVAKAIGIRATVWANHCMRQWQHQHSDRIVTAGMPFQPSANWNDAMRAARKADLFGGGLLLTKAGDGWAIGTCGPGGFTAKWTAATGPLCICAAILSRREQADLSMADC